MMNGKLKKRDGEESGRGRVAFEAYISNKEREVLELIQQGKSATEAATELHISKGAVAMRLRAMRLRYLRAKEFTRIYEEERSRIPVKYL